MRKPSPMLIYLPPLLHFCTCVAITVKAPSAGWIWMWYLDLPVSILSFLLMFRDVHPLICFGILGTLWWYFLSYKAWAALNRSREAGGGP